ncbi:hypothetical protein GpartN1_g3790.t1 [Galdieria partita]|uniref:Uncharacterized protein n=1 Tax=Galdieria partita TaxID=83374 RepID=A0A9C7PWU5_9RHOD|nr:hypothetical protein GpartN1_g3790.t1 [Galdieria partita]
MAYSTNEKLKVLPNTQKDLEQGSLESSIPRRRFSRLSPSRQSFQAALTGSSNTTWQGEAVHNTFLYSTYIYPLFYSILIFLKSLNNQYIMTSKQNPLSKEKYNKVQYWILFLSYEFNMIASYCFSSVLSNYRRTMLLEAVTYRIVQGLNISSFVCSFISSIVLFTVVISSLQEEQKQQTLERMKALPFLVGAELWSHILLFLSCFHFTIEMNHHLGLFAFIIVYLIAAVCLHKTISFLLGYSSWPIGEPFSIWFSFLVSLFHIFSDTTILFQSVIVWEGNLEESWLLLPIATWYDTHDQLHYHSTLQQLTSLILSILTSFLLEMMKMALLMRWQVCFVMTSHLPPRGYKNTIYHKESISRLFHRCLIVASWMGCSMILSLTLSTANFVNIISDYPFSVSWSSLFSISSLYLSHWITLLIYAVITFAHIISPAMSFSGGAIQHKWCKFKWLFVSFCIFLSGHPIVRYFLLSWFPEVFSTFKELLWITTQMIPSCYLLFILYDEAKPIVDLSFACRQPIPFFVL